MHLPNIQAAGKEPAPGTKVLIMLHGRGGSAADILSLAAYLDVEDFALVAPQATGNTWYPYSFLAPPEQNEPWLSSALEVLEDLVTDLYQKGVEPQHLYFLGFSQGACLTLEFVARNAEKYGGVVAFTGGLIGDQIYAENYEGAFDNTPFFIGTSNPDPHVPVERVQATTSLLKEMGAAVTEKIFAGMGHTINQEEIDLANKLVFHPQVEKN